MSEPTPQPAWLTIKAATAYSGLTRTRIYGLLAAQKIRASKAGRLTLLKRSDLDFLLDNLPAWKPKAEMPNATA